MCVQSKNFTAEESIVQPVCGWTGRCNPVCRVGPYGRDGRLVHGATVGNLALHSPGGMLIDLPRAFLSGAVAIDRLVGPVAHVRRPMPRGIDARLGVGEREALRAAREGQCAG